MSILPTAEENKNKMRSILPQPGSGKAKVQGIQSSGGRTSANLRRIRAEQNQNDYKGSASPSVQSLPHFYWGWHFKKNG